MQQIGGRRDLQLATAAKRSPAATQLEIEFDGVINPAAGTPTLSVKTTSDLPATASGTYNIQTGGQISQPR